MLYTLNRFFLTLLGLSLLVLATRLLRNPERILLGQQRRKKAIQRVSTTRTSPAVAEESIYYQRHPLFLTQLAGMLRYEFKLQWRRAALPSLVVGLVMTPAIGALISQYDFQGYREAVANGTLALDVAQTQITATMMPIIWTGVALIAILMVPLLVADTISKDTQVGIREILDTLPLSPAVYLTGKLLSVWLSLLVAVGLTAALTGILWWILVGPFNVLLFWDVWFVGATLLMFINSGSSLLLAAGQPSTRRAIAVGGLYALLCLVGLGVSFAVDADWWRWLNPARPAVMLYYVIGFPGATLGRDDWDLAIDEFVQQAAAQQDLLFSFGAGLVQVALLWLIMWQWLKRRKL
jgi:ABC-type transport system involved in multi-copper enzyme maturation permease subunit